MITLMSIWVSFTLKKDKYYISLSFSHFDVNSCKLPAKIFIYKKLYIQNILINAREGVETRNPVWLLDTYS